MISGVPVNCKCYFKLLGFWFEGGGGVGGGGTRIDEMTRANWAYRLSPIANNIKLTD